MEKLQNESLNFIGADVLEFGAYDAVAHFNIGSKAATEIFNAWFGAR